MKYFSGLIGHFLHYLMSCLSVRKGKWTNIDIGVGTGKVHQNVAVGGAAVAPLQEVALLSRRCGRWHCCRAVASGGVAVAPTASFCIEVTVLKVELGGGFHTGCNCATY